MSMSLLLGWGAYARDKNISARLCAKKVGGGGAYARGGAYLRDTTVYVCASYMVVVCVYSHIRTYHSGTTLR